jgi:hypothetical protein
MIAHTQRDLSQRPSFSGCERRDGGAFGYCRQNISIEKLSPLELQLWLIGATAVVAKCGLQWKTRK